jgi:hypothetical protein
VSSTVTFNGTNYSIPADGDFNWGPQLTAYFIDLATGTFQRSGGTFTLTAEADFGATYGLRAPYFKSRAANPSGVGALRLGNTEGVYWRNAANSADLGLVVNASDALLYNSKTVLFSGLGLIVNADVSASAAIAYSKLNLATSILNADISASAAIAYSKLNLATSILNADINASAAIAYSKLAALTASRLLVSDGSGVVSVSSVTSTEAGYLSGVTSAIQTQLNTKVTNPMDSAGDLIYGGASGVPTKLDSGTSGQILVSGGAGAPSWTNRALDSASRVNTPNGHGSTNNKIRRFTNVNLSTADITYADSATLGGSWTIVTAGLYAVTYVDRTVTALTDRFGISVNGSALTTDIASVTYAQGYRAMSGATSTNEYSSVTTVLYLAFNDVVRAQTGGSINSTDTNSMFEIRRIA